MKTNWGLSQKEKEKIAKRNAEMVQLRKEGKTLEQIADDFGIKRQRVHQILKNIERQEGKADEDIIRESP